MILDNFDDWKRTTATFYKRSTTKDSSGQPIDAFTLTGTAFSAWYWIDSSLVNSTDERFVNSEVGKIAWEPNSLTVNVGDYLLIGSERYYIIGIEPDMMGFGEMALADYRREYGFRS